VSERLPGTAPAPAGLCGRADLLRALAQGGAPLLRPTAALLGYLEQQPDPAPRGDATPAAPVALTGLVETPPPPEVAAQPLADAWFWCLQAYALLPTADPEPDPKPAPGPLAWTNRPATPPVLHPLATWPDLRRRLHPRLAAPREGPALDLGRLVARLARGLLLERLPRLPQRRLAPDLHLIFDRSEHLVPYWADQDLVAGDLARLLPQGTLTRGLFHEGLDAPRLLDRADGRYRPPPQGGLVLVLGDLGSLAQVAPAAPWLALGRALAAADCRAVALVPCRPGRVPRALRRWWDLVQWERPAGLAGAAPWDDSAAARGARTRRLLSLLAPAVRIEPGLLRAVRLALADPALDAALESDLWQDGAVTSTHSEAATLNPRARADLRAAFALEPQVQGQVLDLLRTWRAHLPPEIWFEEVLNLAPASQDALAQPRDLEDARRFFAAVCADLGADPAGDPAATGPTGDWVRRVMTRATGLWDDAQVGRPLVRLDWALHRHRRDYRPPIAIAPAELSAADQEVRRFGVAQQGPELVFAPWDPRQSATGSPLALLETRNRLISIGPPDPDWDPFWETGAPPPWASAWDWDEYGAWVEFAVQGKDDRRVTQRMRWIEPGSFRMGSPADEPGRWDDEGPQHQVTLAEGYWLFDTPCTQALWEAVMGGNPSRFKSPERPVEQVSWDEAQGFIARLNELLPGLGLGLPSEAQWEYACRAGTRTALYSGPIAILGDAKAPALDPIAWYGGNSGQGFELQNGMDRSWLKDMQYPQGKAGTHPVARKDPNPWGLYDMLGNVWEWVQDPWHGNYPGAPADGSAWDSSAPGAARVVRGGSWYDGARYCRCAYRYRYAPDYRLSSLGFRCARVQVREPGQPGGPGGAGRAPGEDAAERARLARPGPRSGSGRVGSGVRRAAGAPSLWERPPGRDESRADAAPSAAAPQPPDGAATPLPPKGTETVRLDGSGTARHPLPLLPAIQVLTDRERLTLHQLAKPAWAGAIGRDRHGLWAEFTLTPPAAEPAPQRRRWWSRKSAPPAGPQPAPAPVIQRLRWIPPGRFLMGSPPDEPGRFDREGPRHQVTIARGYWLFDTPCTQALWSAVMGENPSRFKDPRRPVEQVSWDEVQGFVERINAQAPGLALTLPTEAQWEHAARAGTETALYSGPIEIRGQHDAPALDPIAWYGGNSGVKYDLDEAHETVGDLWQEMQYETKRAGTRRVKGKAANPWGLYDMLGNVWEWCADGQREYGEVSVVDPVGSLEPGAARVVRGGSWLGLARLCRCASRDQFAPDYRYSPLGFRCARVQES